MLEVVPFIWQLAGTGRWYSGVGKSNDRYRLAAHWVVEYQPRVPAAGPVAVIGLL